MFTPAILPYKTPTLAFGARELFTGDASSFTSAALAIGTAVADRLVIAALAARDDGAASANVISGTPTIGGINARRILNNASSFQTLDLWLARVPTGTTAVVSFATAGTVERAAVAVWTLTNYTGEDPYTTKMAQNENPATDTIDIRASAVLLGVGYTADLGGSAAFTTTGVTEDFDDAVEATNRFAGGRFASTGAPETGRTVTFDNGGTFTYGSWAAWR